MRFFLAGACAGVRPVDRRGPIRAVVGHVCLPCAHTSSSFPCVESSLPQDSRHAPSGSDHNGGGGPAVTNKDDNNTSGVSADSPGGSGNRRRASAPAESGRGRSRSNSGSSNTSNSMQNSSVTRQSTAPSMFSSTFPPMPSSLRSMFGGGAAGATAHTPGHGNKASSSQVSPTRIRSRGDEQALLESIPNFVATLTSYEAIPEDKHKAVVGLRTALQEACVMRVFNRAREAAVDTDAIPVLLQMAYDKKDVADTCWALQLIGAATNPADRCKQVE